MFGDVKTRMHSLICLGKDGVERRFVFDDPEDEMTSEGHRELFFSVKTHPEATWFFELQLREKPDGQFQIISIQHHHRPEYASMGIPDSLLPYLTRHLGRRICSSRGHVEGTNEYRTVQATGMWARLVQNGFAEFFAAEGVYRTTKPDGPPNGGRATALADSGVTEGSPSVSSLGGARIMQTFMQSLTDWLKCLDESAASLSAAKLGAPQPHPGEALPEWLRRHERHHRDGVEEAVIAWLDDGAFPSDLSANVRFWTRARFVHAFWLSKTMATPLDGAIVYFPFDESGQISSDARSWLLFDSWDFSGCDWWLHSAGYFTNSSQFDSGSE